MENASITIHDLNVQTALAKLSQILTNKKPVLDDIGAALLKRVQLNFSESHKPDGSPWEKLKHRQGQPLLDTKRLERSITYQVAADGVSIGTNVVYAKVHQFGHTFNRAARTKEVFFRQHKDGSIGRRFVKADKSNFAQTVKVGAYSITIEPRPFFPANGLPPAWQAAVLKVIQRHINKLIG